MYALTYSNKFGVSSDPDFAIHNAAVADLMRSDYSLGDLNQIIRQIAAHRTLELMRLSNGGCLAVTVTDPRSLFAALGDYLIFGWDRDSIFQALAELAASKDPELFEPLRVPDSQWLRGLKWSLWHHFVNQERFTAIINGGAPADGLFYPAVRVNPATGMLPPGAWNQKQHDALAMVLHLLFWQLNQGKASWSDPELQSLAVPFATLLFHLFNKVNVSSESDDSAWEFANTGLHFSSLGTVWLALEEMREFLQSHGQLEYQGLSVSANDVAAMANNCRSTLNQIAMKETIWPDGTTRDVDLAQLDPLLLQALTGRSLVTVGQMTSILENIEKSLARQHGISRFHGDVWNGRANLPVNPGEEAQWTHGAPMMSACFGYLFAATNDQALYQHQIRWFNRGLAGIDYDWQVPEAYIFNSARTEWIADENKPLAWSQAMLAISFASMKASIVRAESAHQQKTASTNEGAAGNQSRSVTSESVPV